MYLLRKVQKSYFHQPKLCSYLKMMSISSLYQFVMWFSGSHLFPIIYPGLGKPFLHFVKPYLQHCKEQYCIETWNVRSMNQGKFSSVLFSHSVVSDSLWPHELQHTRPPCPSTTPRVYPNPCPLSRGCHPTISSSVVPFSSCLHSFPASGSFSRVNSSRQVVKGLKLQLQHQSFQWIFRTDFF